jgi:hypothetical protein
MHHRSVLGDHAGPRDTNAQVRGGRGYKCASTQEMLGDVSTIL